MIYNKLTEIFADFRHFGRKVFLLIFNYLHYKSSTKTAYRQHAGGKGQFLIVNKKLRTTAARAAVHVVNMQSVHIPILFVPFRRSRRLKTAVHRCKSGVDKRLSMPWKRLVLGAKQPVSAAEKPPMAQGIVNI